MSIWQWHDCVVAPPRQHQLSLGEGNTPLISSRRLGPAAGIAHLVFKLETSNPSGSYKDRFAAAAISHMRARGETMCVATSSGNTGSALAAYCAAAAIPCRIAVVETAPDAKLQQMLAYGATLVRVRGFGLDPEITQRTFAILTDIGNQPKAALQISAFKYSPLGMAGVQTIAFEITAALDADHVLVPAGGGGLTLAIVRGFQRLVTIGRLSRCPRIHCVQPAGNDTIAGPLRAGAKQARALSCTTAISGLQVPSVIDGDEVIESCRSTGGTGFTVSDAEVYAVQRRLAREEGVFCEPAGAVSVAAALSAIGSGEIKKTDTVVCLVTGSGFKDLAAMERMTADAVCDSIDWQQLPERFAAAVA